MSYGAGTAGLLGSAKMNFMAGVTLDMADAARAPDPRFLAFSGQAKKGVLFDSSKDPKLCLGGLSCLTGIVIEGLDKSDSLDEISIAVYVDGDDMPFTLISLSEFLLGERPISIPSFVRLRIEIGGDYGRPIKIYLNSH